MHDNLKGGALTETTFFILLALTKPNHGYGIMQFIENITNNRLILGAGTLYGALGALSEKGWIEQAAENANERKKEYVLTKAGKSAVYAELHRIKEVCGTAANILGSEGQL